MMWPEACPRCRGDLSLDSGAYGYFVGCTECGSVLTGPQERVLLGLAPVRPDGHRTSGHLPAAAANAWLPSALRPSRRITRDDLLHLAIRLVKEGRGDGPDLVTEVAMVFEALKRDLEGLSYLIESHQRLKRVARVPRRRRRASHSGMHALPPSSDYDLDGPFIGCIQCGAVLSKRQEQALLRQPLNAWPRQAHYPPLDPVRGR